MADVVFTHAHKVVIDAVIYLAAQINWTETTAAQNQLVLDVLAEALPQARATEQATLDALIMAGVELVAARRALTARAPDAAAGWMIAQMSAHHAVARFAYGRLALSQEKFQQTMVVEDVA